MKPLVAAAALLLLPLSLFAQGVPLSVDQAWEAAQKNNRTLQLRQSEFRAAQAGVQEAVSRRLPTLGFSASSSYLTDPQKGISIKAGSLGSVPNPNAKFPTPAPATDVVLLPDPLHTYFKLGTSLNLPLFTWGKLAEAVTIAETQVVLASLQTNQSLEQTRRDVRKAYFGTVMARESLVILKNMEAVMKSLMDDRNANFSQGTVNRQDVLETESRLAELSQQRQKTEQALRTAARGLGLLTGLDIDPEQLTDGFRSQVPELEATTLTTKAWETSTQRKILEQQGKLARSAQYMEEASGPLRPDFGLNVQMEFNGQAVPITPNWRDTWNPNITISIGTNGTWFDGFKADARVKTAAERVTQAGIGLEMLRDGLEVQVQQGYEAVVGARAALVAKTAAKALAEERNRNAQVAYENELATREDSQGAELGELMAHIDALNAGFQLESALTDLETLVGQRLP